MKFLVSVLIALLFLSGCSSKKRVVVMDKDLPSWYQNPQMSNTQSMYAIGEGQNQQDAVANALNSMLSTLGVSISSEFNSKTTVQGGEVESYQKTSTNEVNAKVKQIRVSNYEIINSDDFDFKRYLVEIKSDRKKLFSGLEKELKQKFSTIQSKDKESRKYHALKRLEVYKSFESETRNVRNILIVMHSLKPNFDDTLYLRKLQIVDSQYNNLLSKISFSINTNKDAKNLRAVISNGLTDEKYKINNKRSKNHFKVYISSTTNKAKSYGFNLARSAISITTKDYKGNVVASNKLNITGQATQGTKIAKENVAVKLNTMVKKDGISKVLGLGILKR